MNRTGMEWDHNDKMVRCPHRFVFIKKYFQNAWSKYCPHHNLLRLPHQLGCFGLQFCIKSPKTTVEARFTFLMGFFACAYKTVATVLWPARQRHCLNRYILVFLFFSQQVHWSWLLRWSRDRTVCRSCRRCRPLMTGPLGIFGLGAKEM